MILGWRVAAPSFRKTPLRACPPWADGFFDKLQNMGVHVTVDASQRLVISTFSGDVTDADIAGFPSLIRSHPDFDPSFSEILDFSAVTAASVSTSVVQEVARRVSHFNLDSLHVVIAPQEVIYGLARMAQVFGEKTKPNAVVVRSMKEAREFLRLHRTGSD